MTKQEKETNDETKNDGNSPSGMFYIKELAIEKKSIEMVKRIVC